jgi:hypothetical protein
MDHDAGARVSRCFINPVQECQKPSCSNRGDDMLYQYRILENDDEGDPLDHGVVRADSREAALTFIRSRSRALDLEDVSVSPPLRVRLYPLRGDGASIGVLDCDDYEDHDIAQPPATPTVASTEAQAGDEDRGLSRDQIKAWRCGCGAGAEEIVWTETVAYLRQWDGVQFISLDEEPYNVEFHCRKCGAQVPRPNDDVINEALNS